LTTRVTPVECVAAPAVPLIVKGEVPAGVVEVVASVSVEESAGFGANVAVVPAGTPVTESVTGSLKPPVRLTVTEKSTLPPWTTLCDEGAAAIEKSGCAAA
jgi:hypothetical protein